MQNVTKKICSSAGNFVSLLLHLQYRDEGWSEEVRASNMALKERWMNGFGARHIAVKICSENLQ